MTDVVATVATANGERATVVCERLKDLSSFQSMRARREGTRKERDSYQTAVLQEDRQCIGTYDKKNL